MGVRPDRAPNPAHIVMAIQANQIVCECGAPATCKGWFTNLSSTGAPTTNAMLLCDACAAQCDDQVKITGINERPHVEHKWIVKPGKNTKQT